MKKYWMILAIAALTAICGCSTPLRVSPAPRVPTAELANYKVNANLGLFLTTEFEEFEWQGKSRAEMSNLYYDLGYASKMLFMETFVRYSKKVKIVDRQPPYQDADLKDLFIVVKPAVASFSEDHPSMTRTGTYTAKISYMVQMYNSLGQLIQEKVYEGEGAAPGEATHSPGSNYARPAELAMRSALVKIMADLTQMTANVPAPTPAPARVTTSATPAPPPPPPVSSAGALPDETVPAPAPSPAPPAPSPVTSP